MTLSLRPPPKAPGRLSRALTRLLMKRATVAAVESLADRFRLITLEGPALAGATWTPGQKIQIAMGSAFVARTYTPLDWDLAAGRIRILGYAHGVGPGSAWLETLRPGVECDIFGPRASLEVRDMTGPLAVFGDETSMGLAHALAGQDRGRTVACAFEVGDPDGARRVATRLGLANATLFARSGDDGHMEAMAAGLASLAATGASFVLTGRAGAIQRLRLGLKTLAVPPARIAVKAYWAPGKVGMD
ncbi:siderophore-interacting protein [Caulobacter soli]|uniref:siderophore-interacting protein n=1 Tax=Caulobacter soli TaxID=2708539 RepID=UPI0013EC3509|nr:siderophore-interacting protein [Caulobacter soli]